MKSLFSNSNSRAKIHLFFIQQCKKSIKLRDLDNIYIIWMILSDLLIKKKANTIIFDTLLFAQTLEKYYFCTANAKNDETNVTKITLCPCLYSLFPYQ